MNRSYSESDLSIDNLAGTNFFNQRQRSTHVFRRTVYMEEIIDNRNSAAIRRYASSNEIIGIPSSFTTRPDMCCEPSAVKSSHSFFKDHSNVLQYPNRIIPMEVDNQVSQSVDETDYCENDTLIDDVKTDYNKKQRYQELHNILKSRNSYRKNNLDNLLDKRIGMNYDQGIIDKTEPRSMIVPLESANKGGGFKLLLFVLAIIIVIVAYYAVYKENYLLYVNNDAQLANIRSSLHNNIQEQKNVVDIVIRNFEHRKYWKTKLKILAFTGPRGVGKTFTANVVKKHFHQKLVHELYGTELMYKIRREQISRALDKCCLNLIIVDDIKKQDTVELLAFIQTLPKDYFILVLSIFNFDDTDDLNFVFKPADVKIVRNSFEDSHLNYELIVFEHFNENQVKDWIKRELTQRSISEKFHSFVINAVVKGHDAQLQGLKGIMAKLLFELEKLGK